MRWAGFSLEMGWRPTDASVKGLVKAPSFVIKEVAPEIATQASGLSAMVIESTRGDKIKTQFSLPWLTLSDEDYVGTTIAQQVGIQGKGNVLYGPEPMPASRNTFNALTEIKKEYKGKYPSNKIKVEYLHDDGTWNFVSSNATEFRIRVIKN